jgi:nucleoside-diphosphate-sugar epimerase
MAKRTALVTGASGLAGGYMLAHLLQQGGWDIVAVSRRKPRGFPVTTDISPWICSIRPTVGQNSDR